jgi:molybdopterin synthase catalytic subunit
MRIRLRLFASCRDRVGSDHLDLELPPDNPTVRALLRAVGQTAPELAPLLPALRVAVNQRFADDDQVVGPGDEVALIPPVSGGADDGQFRVQAEPLDPRAVEAAVAHPGAGAVVTFQGTVRNRTGEHEVTHLDYEAYDAMAERVLREVGAEAEARWPGVRVAVVHRTGRVEVGEVSVVIAVSSPHRPAAFEACRHVIERLKEDVPIWKKEARRDGSVWVGRGS